MIPIDIGQMVIGGEYNVKIIMKYLSKRATLIKTKDNLEFAFAGES